MLVLDQPMCLVELYNSQFEEDHPYQVNFIYVHIAYSIKGETADSIILMT